MSESASTSPSPGSTPARPAVPLDWLTRLPHARAGLAVAVAASLVLFSGPLHALWRAWLDDPEAGHGLLLVPLALWLAYRAPRRAVRPRPGLGLASLAAAIILRHLGEMAAEPFTMSIALVLAICSLTIAFRGLDQLRAWWLPVSLLTLSIPLPVLVTSTIAVPLQLQASRIGATLLEARYVPVQLAGNVIRLPGYELFVTEACSGLRSLTALLSLGVLVAGLALRHPLSRAILVAAALPVAVLVNGLRIFVTGFVVHFVDPAAGQGVMHITQGWLMFMIALCCIGAIAALARWAEMRLLAERAHV